MSLKLRNLFFLLLFGNAVWAYADDSGFDYLKPCPIFEDLNLGDDDLTSDDSDADGDSFAPQTAWHELAADYHSLIQTCPHTDQGIISFYYHSLYPRPPPFIS